MRKQLLTLFTFLVNIMMIFGQIGFNTTDPKAIFDITAKGGATDIDGFLAPRLTRAQLTSKGNTLYGLNQEGALIYINNITGGDATGPRVNITAKGYYYFDGTVWKPFCCCSTTPIATLDCAGAIHNGTLTTGTPATGVSSILSYTGGNGSAHNGQTITSTGVMGLTATLLPGNFANGNGTLTYNITGIPSGSGTASFAINIGGQTCTLTRTVSATPIATLNCAGAIHNGTLITATPATGVSSILSYTGGNGSAHSGQTITSTGVMGLTATLLPGNFANGNGTLTYNITGIPSGSGTASFAINIGGQTCTLTRTVNSNVITFATCGVNRTYQMVTSPTGKVWLDRNLGASRVATSPTDYLAYGDLYQWGRGNDNHQCINYTSSYDGAPVNGVTYVRSATDNPGHNLFINHIDAASIPGDWRNPPNNNLWQGVNGINNPCPAGFRIPTQAELNAERALFPGQNATGAYNSILKLPLPGFRRNSQMSPTTPGIGGMVLFQEGIEGLYWTSNTSANASIIFDFANNVMTFTDLYRAHATSVRCIKD